MELGGGSGMTFDTQTLDIAYASAGSSHTGPGTFQVARFTLADWAQASYAVTGFEEGSPTPPQATTLQGTIAAPPLTLSVVRVAGAPDGYRTYDFFADVKTSMGPMELLLETTNPGDIYQISTTPEDAAGAFDTYVTIGPGCENPTQTSIHGGAADLGGGANVVFDEQNLNITWSPNPGIKTGHGEFHIARVTLDMDTTASWTLVGLQNGNNDFVTLTGDLSLLPLPRSGDVNGNDYVSAPDLTTVITNWGMTGATREQGDLSGDGTVSAPDYTEVITFWGTGTAPTEPGPVPEPMTLALLAVSGGLAVLIRRRR